MIKAEIFIKLEGTTTQEQLNWLLTLSVNVVFFADAEKTREITRKTYTYVDVELQNATLQYVYWRLSQEVLNPEMVLEWAI